MTEHDDEFFMRKALEEAAEAARKGEVPVGAVIVCNGRIVARTHNLTEALNDVTAHAEMMAITSAANALGGKYLPQCTLYVTVEPCPMCAGALAWAQIGRIVYGASDFKRGYSRLVPPAPAATLEDSGKKPSSPMRFLHPKTVVTSGVLAEECTSLMTGFFRKRR